ncbi:Cadherin-related tumor suppressor [Orchesella cincta]|uniref:Cadherin-related tumor suppressor n=1 Tax=Orchesella cincta TaxID=48709 RepID=A0A1D2MYF8_ORCCI|nr:Cadherin-related tumor suppressor [Orchesella cincta]
MRTPRLTGTGMVRVLISDDNDCDPTFDQDRYEFSVFENSAQGTSVAKVAASDADEGLNAKLSYELLGDGTNSFVINKESGEIFTNGAIDREAKDVYTFKVIATDTSPIFRRSSTATVTVNVNDQNDNPPKFQLPSYSVKIPDNIASGSYVIGVSATDADFGMNSKLRYFMTGADADKFQINESTGVIKSLRHLNKSGKTQLNVEVHAIDAAPKDPLSTSVNVQVNLANHMRFPQIKAQVNSFSFKENVTTGHVVTTLQGLPAPSIPPTRQGRKFSYYIGGGNLGNAFVVDRRSGQVKVSSSGLDYETARNYELWVEVCDDEAPDFRNAVPLYINVTDVNDNPPIFKEKIYNLSIPEEEPGSKLITTLVATDKDTGKNGEMRYYLTPKSEARYGSVFKIDADSGKTYAKVKLDREEQAQYIFDVQAVDKGSPPKTGTATVIVNVQDLNDNPMKFTRLFSVNVTENVPVGTFVIQVTSVDKDIGENANCSYSLTDNAQKKFQIDPYSGNVTVSGQLDRETQDEYLLKVSAVDGSWRAETLLTITIEDVNDQAPEFEYSYYNFNIPEGQQPVTFIGQVTAVDRDKRGPNSVVSYSLKQPSELFSVDPVSGEIFSKRPLKYINSWRKFSPENEHNVVVVATDNGKPPMSSECSITINVVNGNNHAPSFEHSPYFSPVLENTTIGHKILQIIASDTQDYGVNSELEYLKISGNGTEYFDIDKNTGWIVLAKSLSGKNNNHSTSKFRAPMPRNVSCNRWHDRAPGPNAAILYNITKGNDKGWFAINASTGAVSINKSLDYDTHQEYRLVISATDRGYHSKSSEAELTVILTDVNDNAPYFEQQVYDAYINENSPVSQQVFVLEAKDKDSPKNAVIRYAIVGGSGKHAFNVDPVSGVITSSKVFDYEYRQDYILDVLASNPDSNLVGGTKIHVHVNGVNEFYPKFVQPVFHFAVSESALVGSLIGSVQATDEDGGEDGVMYYLFVGSSNDRGFSINPTSGSITVSRRLDRESQSRVVLTVLAKNMGPIRGNDTDEAQVIITVQDGNDPPVFEKEVYEAQISEDAIVGSKIIGVKATDIDVRPSNNRFTYEILNGNHNKTFKIDPIAGVIYTAELLDRESVSTYSLTVGAIDTGVPPQTGTTIVKINLLDVNDNGPTLQNSSRSGTVLENEPANSRVMTLHAQDLDLSPNAGPFTFALIGGPDAGKFKIDTKTGHVTTTDSFDRETTPELRILVEITDNGKPPLKTREEVKILVGDKNDCPSQARNAHIILYTFNNIIPSEKVATVEPLDPDVIGQYTCRLESARDILRISSSCDIHLSKIPSYKRHSIKILGDDGRHPEVASQMQFEFGSIDNATLNNSIIIRAFGVTHKKILEKSYTKLLAFWRQIFMRAEPKIYGLIPQHNATDIILAVNSGDQYLTTDQVMSTLIANKGHVEILLDASIIINYSVCSTQNVCQNGASCTQYLQLHTSQQVSDSPLLILSSPTIDLSFSCKCPPGFTGSNCQLRKEPCQPNPCESGASCIKQGYDFVCICPAHRNGKRCELERSSACQSNPCKNGGSCQENQQSGTYFCLCRPGFFGNICQTASNACKPNPCLNGGECVSSVGPNSAFPRCKCQKHYYGRYCEKSAFGFSLGSYMAFPSLDPNTNDISVIFSTNKKNALLVYDFGEQIGGRSDFVAIQLVEGKVSFSYGGARTAITSIAVSKYVSDGKWYRITATRNSRVISLTVSSCEDSGEVCTECRPGDSSCYANVVGPTGTLNFNGQPLLVAGVKNVEVMLERPGQIQTDDFVGCIHSVVVNGRHLNMSSPMESRGVSENCQRVEDVCQSSGFNKCGGTGQCIDAWDSYMCRCDNVLAPNCNDAFTAFSFQLGAFIEFRPSEMFTRSQILHAIYSESDEGRIKREISSSKKSLMFSFRTIQPDAILMYAASGKDYTLIELENGDLKFTSQNGASKPITMTIVDHELIDGSWHSLRLTSHHRTLQIFVDDKLRGDELDTATAHDFLDPYLMVLTLGGLRDDFVPSNKINHGFTGCMANFTIRDQLLPFNGTGMLFEDIMYHGKVSRGCSNAIAGAATAPDPLSIGVTLVIVFFVVLLVAILVSFVIFRLKRREKNPLPMTSATKPSPPGPGSGDVVRSHIMEGDAEAIRNLVRNSKKLSGTNAGYHKPDIIERTTSISNTSANNSPTNNGMVNSNNGISLDPELPDMPEHYDLENASSIAPSDIDIVYHYKGFRDNLGGRNKSSPFRHNHHFPGSRQSPGIRQSPISNVLKSTPLARLSPSSELSQQTTPRILTLQDISGKPLQSALLATTQKDAMSQSERSLNISQSSSRSSMVNASSQGTTKKRKKGVGDSNTSMTIGLTAEEIERLNNSRHKNNSSLVSTLDAVSSSESEDRRKNKLSNLLQPNQEMMQRSRDTSSDDDESGNDSFTCSEFEYDNEKRDFRPPHMMFPKRTEREGEEAEESFRGSLSTLVASDDDLAYINSYSKSTNPNGGPSSMGWDYLLNWGPNFENLVGVFKDIAELPDESAPAPPIPKTSNPPNTIVNTLGQSSRSSRYPTPRPSEDCPLNYAKVTVITISKHGKGGDSHYAIQQLCISRGLKLCGACTNV